MAYAAVHGLVLATAGDRGVAEERVVEGVGSQVGADESGRGNGGTGVVDEGCAVREVFGVSGFGELVWGFKLEGWDQWFGGVEACVVLFGKAQ